MKMKVTIKAIGILLDLDAPLAGSLVFESVVDEECSGGGAGTMACLDAGYTGDGAVFVDGNDMTITLGCGGFLVKQAIDEFKQERETEHPEARVNLGIFDSGVHAAVVPGSAYMSLNIVYEVAEAEQAEADGYGWSGKPIRDRFEEVIRAAEAEDEWLREHPYELTWVKDLIPFDQPDSEPWAQRLARVYREMVGEEPVFNRMMAWSDSAYPSALFDIPTALFGPATGGEARGPTEHIEIAQMVRCTKVLASFLAQVLSA